MGNTLNGEQTFCNNFAIMYYIWQVLWELSPSFTVRPGLIWRPRETRRCCWSSTRRRRIFSARILAPPWWFTAVRGLGGLELSSDSSNLSRISRMIMYKVILARLCQFTFFSIQVEELDPFETVLAMRRQRMKMVQKPMQYYYMFRCLADYVAETTSDYI